MSGRRDMGGSIFRRLPALLGVHRLLYGVAGFFFRGKAFPEARRNHTYGVVIAARNEERVIGELLDSIALQDYDPALLHVFVVADNCTDSTARISREHGATVYERFDPDRARKGWALEYLFENIDRDYGIGSFDAYLFFDADNLLAPDFVTQINRAFDASGDIAVGYRNAKNFDTSFISAGYALHFMDSILFYHRPRALLGLSTHIAGTGFAVSSEILKGGWRWHCLTEDTQFCLSQIAEGRRIEFCEAAEFFDEQPYTVPVMVRQRLRWVKGRLACFFLLAPKLLAGILRCRKRKFSCYDMLFYIFPHSLASALRTLLRLGRALLPVALSAGLPALAGICGAVPAALAALAASWLRLALRGAVIAVRERRRIRCSTPKLVLYTLLWPFFNLSGPPIALASVFMRVRWKPIRHDRSVSISDLDGAAGLNTDP